MGKRKLRARRWIGKFFTIYKEATARQVARWISLHKKASISTRTAAQLMRAEDYPIIGMIDAISVYGRHEDDDKEDEDHDKEDEDNTD